LNTASVFSLDLVDSFPSSVILDDLADVPSLVEIRNALSLIAAVGINVIPPEMVKVCSDELLMYLFDLFTSLWDSAYLLVFGIVGLFLRSGEMPLWCLYLRTEICYHVTISGESVCLMWWAKIIQQRLQAIVEEEVADSQCGFHCNRGCTDTIFCAH